MGLRSGPAAKRHAVYLGLQEVLPARAINFSAVHEIIESAHKPKRLDRENCKTEVRLLWVPGKGWYGSCVGGR